MLSDEQLIKIFLESFKRAANAQTPFEEMLIEKVEERALDELNRRKIQVFDTETLNVIER